MNPVDIILIIVLLTAVFFAVRKARSKKGACCGNCAECMQKHNRNCP